MKCLLCLFLGPGRREPSAAYGGGGASKARRSAPSAPAGGDGGCDRQRSYSGSLRRFSAAPEQHPHLPKSGAQHKAKSGGNYDPKNAEFMRTPESGACG